MSTIKKFYKSHNTAVFLFCFLSLYSLFISEGKLETVSDNAMAFHAVDFSMGFCSKMLVGQIFNLFFDNVTQQSVMLLEIVFLAGFFITVSFLLEKLINKTLPEYRKSVFVAVIVLLTGPCTFSLVTKAIGMLDAYWLFACAVFFLFLSDKKLYVLMIPLFIGTILIHYATVFCYAPFFVIIMLYKISCCENRRERYYLWIITVLSAAIAIALALYFMMFEQNNVTYTFEEFKEIMMSRGVKDTLYYDYALYRAPQIDGGGYEEYLQYQDTSGTVTENLISLITLQIRLALDSVYFGSDILPFVLLSPVVFFIYYFFFVIFKQNKANKVKRFSLFCASVLFFLTYIVGKLTSYDNLRWIIHSFVPLLLMLLYILYIEKDEVVGIFSALVKKIPAKLVVTYLLIYGIIVLDPYM